MGLFKRIRRHLIKSILSLKNTHENVFLTAIASSSTLTWFTYQIRPSLCIFGLTCSLSSSYTGAPQSVFFLSPNGGDTTLAVLSTGLISSYSSPHFPPNTVSTTLCLGNTFRFQFKCDCFTQHIMTSHHPFFPSFSLTIPLLFLKHIITICYYLSTCRLIYSITDSPLRYAFLEQRDNVLLSTVFLCLKVPGTQ